MGNFAFIFTRSQWSKLGPSLDLSIWSSETEKVTMLQYVCGYLPSVGRLKCVTLKLIISAYSFPQLPYSVPYFVKQFNWQDWKH